MITKPMLKEFRKDFQEAVKQVEDKYGLEITLANITFDENYFSGRIKAQVNGAETPQEKDYKVMETLRGLPPLGTKIDINGKEFEISGYNYRARKNKILIKNNQGKTYVTSIQTILHSQMYKPDVPKFKRGV